MDLRFTGKYKSISEFEWNDIPRFSIITGKNGTGKSQLLELIKGSIFHEISGLVFDGEAYSPHDVTFLKSEWELNPTGSINLITIQQQEQEFYNAYRNEGSWHTMSNRPRLKAALYETKNRLNGKAPIKTSLDEFLSVFPELLIEYENQLGQKISQIFYEYRLKEIQLLSDNQPIDKIILSIGPKPWDVLRDIIHAASLPFEFSNPSNLKIRDTYEFQLKNTITDQNVILSNLSSGEKVLLSLIFLLYNSQEKGVFPKLMLLDEPDAHLHPSMSKQLIDVVNNLLVQKYGVRVIMTTHSPSTVVLTPLEGLYEMTLSSPRIRKAQTKNEIVSLLTEGLVYVGEGTKYFIVEDKDDVEFYSSVYKYGVSEKIITGTIPMVFMPASTKEQSGGKTIVESWAVKLQSSGLDMLIQGLIDEDSGNVTSPGVHKIRRYSIENYLVDPIITYAALMDRNEHNNIIDVGLRFGEEYKLRIADQELLTRISNAILAVAQPKVETYFPDYKPVEDSAPVTVSFPNKIILEYPSWIISRRGKTILNQAYHAAFKPGLINFSTLNRALHKVNFYPIELIELIDSIRK
jgi:AAA15 family ATPase/GTPase